MDTGCDPKAIPSPSTLPFLQIEEDGRRNGGEGRLREVGLVLVKFGRPVPILGHIRRVLLH